MESDYDIPLEEEGTPYVTIEEMKKLLAAQRWYNHKYEELELDEQSGLYFTEYFVHDGGGLLRAHMLVEQCMEHFDELDWKRITNGYDFDIISRIEHLMENPLVWIDGIPDELARQYVVTGRVAEEKSSEERNRCTPYADLNIMLSNERIEWFANQLPTRKDIYNKYSYYGVPKDMILWGLILTDEYEKFSADLHAPDKIDPCTGREYWPYCNPQHFRFVINRINDKFGSQKAAQIVRLLRDDWQDIKSMKLFGIDKLTPERVEEFRQCLFEGMDRNLRAWDAETPKEEKAEQEPVNNEDFFCRITQHAIDSGHAQEVEDALRSAAVSAPKLVKAIKTNEALGYLDTQNLSSTELYDLLNEHYHLPFKVRVFQNYRSK